MDFYGNQLSTKSKRRGQNRKSVVHNPHLLSVFYIFCTLKLIFLVCVLEDSPRRV